MKADKQRRLKAAGWRTGSVAEYLGLSKEEARVIEWKLSIANAIRRRRQCLGLTQQQLATQFGSSQSRLAKIEAGDPAVSMELLLTALLNTGATDSDVVQLLSHQSDVPAHGLDICVGSFDDSFVVWDVHEVAAPLGHWPREVLLHAKAAHVSAGGPLEDDAA